MRALLGLLIISFSICLCERASGDEKEDLAKCAKDLKSKDVKVRLKAAEKLADCGEDAAKPLCDAMLDKDAKVAQAALVSLEKVSPHLYKQISTLVLDESRRERASAINSIADLGRIAKPAIALLAARGISELGRSRTASHEVGLEQEYTLALAKIATDEADAVRYFKALAAYPEAWAKAEAAKWLVAWAGDMEARRKDLLPVFRAGLVDDEDSAPIIEAAGKLGTVGKPLLPALKQLKLSKHAPVREAATSAVALIEKP